MPTTNPLPSRAELDQDYTWNLTSLFETETDYEQELSAAREATGPIAGMQGKLQADNLYDFLEQLFDLNARIRRLGLYASLPTSADANDQVARSRLGSFMATAQAANQAVAWVEPELLQLGRETLAGWTGMDPRLEKYGRFFDRLEARREHVRSGEVESLLGALADPFGGAARARGSLVSSDITYSPVIHDDGETSEVAPSTIDGLLSSGDRDVRRQAFRNYADAFLSFRNTLADLYLTRVKQAAFSARIRNYPSTVEEALAPREVPRAALEAVIRVFERRIGVWHRYWAVRRKLLGVAEHHPWY